MRIVRLALTALLQVIGLLVVAGIVVTLPDLRLGTSTFQNIFVLGGLMAVAAGGVFLIVFGHRLRRR